MHAMTNDLQEHMHALERSSAYHVERVIKQAPQEITEEVFFEGKNGAKLGPFVRKRINRGSDLGKAYELLYEVQQQHRRFLYLPRIRDCYKTEDALVVVMDWVAGETLAETLQHQPPSLAFAAPLFEQLCEAVAELHNSFDPPIIHRDITPSNIVLSGGTPTLIDLGIARSYKENVAYDTHQLGTYGFAAPEQFGFGQSDVRTDVYALGMVLYYCCTGETPDAQARAQGFTVPGVPLEVSHVIEKATALDPNNRYDSVQDLELAFAEASQAYRLGSSGEEMDAAARNNAAEDSPEKVAQESYPPPTPLRGWGVTPHPAYATSPKSSDRVFGEHESTPRHDLGEEKALPHSPFPFVPALIWDTVLVLFWLICVGSMTFLGVFTDPVTGAETPALQKPFLLALALLVFTVPASLLISSRPLQEINQKWCWSWKTRLAILGCELVGFIILLVLVALFGQ